jgi:hypothetical protein
MRRRTSQIISGHVLSRTFADLCPRAMSSPLSRTITTSIQPSLLLSDVYSPSDKTIQILREKSGTLFQGSISASTFLDAVDKLGPISDGLLPRRAYRTNAHKELYEVLFRKVETLSSGRYVGTRGVASASIVGAKGIGKTTALTSFATLCPLVAPNVVPVFVTLNHVGLKDHALLQSTLAENVAEQLEKLGIPVQSYRTERVREVVQALHNANKYLLLLVDELDQLYRLDPASSLGKWALQTLSELVFFGDQSSGRVCTLICGSSAMLPLLITRNVNDSGFPLLSRAPSLNGNKYQTKRVSASRPTDLSAVSSITGLDQHLHLGALRQFAFASGATPREVEKMFLEATHDSLATSVLPAESIMAFNTLDTENRRVIREVLLDRLVDLNKDLLARLVTENHVNVRAVYDIPWENEFQPLLFDEARAACGELGVDIHRNFLTHLLHLSDRGWLTLDGVKNGAPEKIYPPSLLQAAAQHLMKVKGQSWTTTLQSFLCKIREGPEYKQALEIAAKGVGNLWLGTL